MKDKISIIMPAYNSDKYIKEAIESVILQTYTNWELLIVDDGSTDNTGKIIDEYSIKDERIKVFHISKSGVSNARNLALDNATGKWISFLDSDDILPNYTLETLILNSNDCDLVIGNCKFFPMNIEVWNKIEETTYYSDLMEIKPKFSDLFYVGFFSAIWGKLIKKETINIRFDKRFQNAEDTLFFSEFIGNLKGIRLIKETIYYYRSSDINSLSHQFNPKLMDALELVIKNYTEYFKDDEITEKLKIYYLYHSIRTIEKLYEKSNVEENEVKEFILSLLEKETIKKMQIKKYSFSKKYQRRMSLLLIGDINLIMDEFNKTKKESK